MSTLTAEDEPLLRRITDKAKEDLPQEHHLRVERAFGLLFDDNYRVINGAQVAKVVKAGGITYDVDLKEKTCTCPDFNQHSNLCKHRIAVVLYHRLIAAKAKKLETAKALQEEPLQGKGELEQVPTRDATGKEDEQLHWHLDNIVESVRRFHFQSIRQVVVVEGKKYILALWEGER